MKIQLCDTVLKIAIESDGSVKDRMKTRMSSQHKVFTSVNVSFQLPFVQVPMNPWLDNRYPCSYKAQGAQDVGGLGN